MAIDPVNVGAVPNDGTGDALRTAFGKVNANEAFLDTKAGNAQVAADAAIPSSEKGAPEGVATLDAAERVTEPLAASDETLKAWTEAGAYEATSVTLDSDQVVTTATVAWPDGSAGTFTTTTKSAAWLAVDAYTVSHTASGKTVTQAAVTRDADGNVTTKPALSVA